MQKWFFKNIFNESLIAVQNAIALTYGVSLKFCVLFDYLRLLLVFI